MGKRELVVLLCLSYWCLLVVVWFKASLDTNIIHSMKRMTKAWINCADAQAVLRLCHSHATKSGFLASHVCFVVHCTLLYVHSSFAIILTGRESWLLCLVCLPVVSWWLCGSSSRCHGFVCGL